jgi:hypothetical protein
MSRSRVLVPLLALAVLSVHPAPAFPQSKSLLDAIGTVDYARGPSVVKVGDWARYQMSSRSELGVADDYTVTVMIAGEEEFWGEECFWVETWTLHPNGAVIPAATLVSRAVFDDTLPARNVQLYQRKRVQETDDHGNPLEQVMRRGSSALKSRVPPEIGLHHKVDTLGVDTVQTAKGTFTCRQVRYVEAVGSTAQSADSSQYTEVREERIKHFDHSIPVTGIAREDIDYGMQRRTWLVGRSQESTPMRVMDRSKGRIQLLDFGSGGLKPMLVRERYCHSLAEQRALAAQAAAKARAAARPSSPAKPRPAAGGKR